MRLLFDANLSPKLVSRLAALFPGATHVFETGLVSHSSDQVIWDYAKTHGMVIVTSDSDFLDLAQSLGAPPKVIRLENCNYRTARVEDLLRRNAVRITEWEQGPQPVLTIRNV